MLHLDSMHIHKSHLLASGPPFVKNVLVEPTAKIGEGCLIGPDVSIGANCVIEDGVRLSNCVIMRGVHVKKHTKVRRTGMEGGVKGEEEGRRTGMEGGVKGEEEGRRTG